MASAPDITPEPVPNTKGATVKDFSQQAPIVNPEPEGPIGELPEAHESGIDYNLPGSPVRPSQEAKPLPPSTAKPLPWQAPPQEGWSMPPGHQKYDSQPQPKPQPQPTSDLRWDANNRRFQSASTGGIVSTEKEGANWRWDANNQRFQDTSGKLAKPPQSAQAAPIQASVTPPSTHTVPVSSAPTGADPASTGNAGVMPHNGARLNYLPPGAVMGAPTGNAIIRNLNPLLNWQVVTTPAPGAQSGVTICDGKTVLQIAVGGGDNSGGGGGGETTVISTGTGLYAAGEYSEFVNYGTNALVYTESGTLGRSAWVCEIPNGPPTPHVPAIPEPTPTYWRCYANANMGPVTLYVLTSYNGNTLTCQPIGGGDFITVAVQPELQQISSESIDGESWTYDTYSGQSRMAHGPGGVSIAEVITPRFIVGNLVPVWACNNASSLVEGCNFLCITGREWATQWPTS